MPPFPRHGEAFECAPLRYFQLRDLFDPAQLQGVVDRPAWAERHPDVAAARRSADVRARDAVLVPGEIVLAVARECRCVGAFYADPDRETLRIAPHGGAAGSPAHRDVTRHARST
jgi:hypothetical protein